MTSGIGTHQHHQVVGVFELAGVSRPCEGSAVAGDAFVWTETGNRLTIVVADGLGHGAPAREAADRALASVLEMPAIAADRMVHRCHAALVRTRGAAVAVAQIDLEARLLTFCGVGNVAIREHPRQGGRGASIPGIVGMRLPSLRVFQSQLHEGDLICIHSDGIDGSFNLAELPEQPLTSVVRTVQERWGVPHDDATIVALRVHGPSKTSEERA